MDPWDAGSGLSFDQTANKGVRLANKFDEDVPPSKYGNYGDLHSHGWVCTYNRSYQPNPQDAPFMTMYNDLGLICQHKNNRLITWEQQRKVRVCERVYHPTYGVYRCILNPRAIIVLTVESPDFKGYVVGIADDEVIPLKHWSDVIFLQWRRYCEERRVPVPGLRKFIQTNISDSTTVDILDEAEALSRWPIPVWPNPNWKDYANQGTITFPFGDLHYNTILGTPSAVGPAYFLLQHRRDLGRLCFESVICFRKVVDPNHLKRTTLNLCFNVEPCK